MIVSALLLAAAAPAPSADEAEIRRLRTASNAAIAAHDVDAVMAIVAPNAITVRGSGTVARNPDEMRATWVTQLAAPGFDRYVRTPERVEVGTPIGGVTRAAESGRWLGRLRTARGESRPFGRYLAHWATTGGNWRMVADIYVTLGCDGAGC